MADFITQFPANEVVSRENFNSRIAQANTGLATVQSAAAVAQTTADSKAALNSPALTGSPTVNGVSVATAAAPAEYALPLATGYAVTPGYKCCYSKAQDGLVLVHLAVKSQSGDIPVGGPYVFTTLPAGFRPSEAVGHTTAQVSIAANVNGDVGSYVLTQAMPNLIMSISFYAAS